MVSAGEENNRIGPTLESVAEDLEREDDLISKVRSALVYPGVILGLALIVCYVMLITIVPTFKEFYASIGDGSTALPGITVFLIWLSGVAPFIAVGVGALTVGGVLWYRKNKDEPKVREQIDKYKMKIPVIGKLLHLVALSRFTKSMASLVESGVLLPRALEISAEVTNNYQMAVIIRKAQVAVEEGQSIDKPLRGEPMFPPSLVNMMKTGQESGSMVNNMRSRATFYDAQIGRMTKNLTELLEPMMMVVIGCLVGFIVMGVMAPYLNMGSLLEGA
jgi:type IV pilus assembly protein PilC